MKIDVSTESLALLSPKTEQHEIFPCNGSCVIKQRGTLKWISISCSCSQLIFTEFYYHESILKYVIPKIIIRYFEFS